MKFKTFAAALAATTIAGSAFAADLPSRKVAPVMAPVPVFTWTGFYVGVNAGLGWNASGGQNGTQVNTGLGSNGAALGVAGPTTGWNNGVTSPIGALGGLTAGYNMQVSPLFVAGIEADIQLASIRGNGTAVTAVPVGVNGIVAHTGAIAVSQKTDWFGTLRGRIGVTPFAPTFLVYATGGLAYGSAKTSFTMFDNFTVPAVLFGASTGSSTKFGWTAGVGAEWAITQNWSLKGEWLYVDLGRSTLNGVNSVELFGPAPFPLYATTQSYRHNFNVLRAGLNYRFGGAPAPVVAKY